MLGYEEKKRILRAYREMNAHLDALAQERAHWEKRSGAMQVERIAEQIEEEVAQISQDRERITQALRRLEMEDAQAALVLRLRYIDGFSWPKVARKAYLSEEGAFAAHRRGIQKLTLKK